MGPAGKFNALSGCLAPEFKKKEPLKELGFPPVGMAEGDYAAALSSQRPLERFEEGTVVPQNNPGYPVEKKEVQPGQEFAKQDDPF
jgi:hypothetical protein